MLTTKGLYSRGPFDLLNTLDSMAPKSNYLGNVEQCWASVNKQCIETEYQILAHRLCMARKNEVCNSILPTKMLKSLEKIVMLAEKSLSWSSRPTT